MSIFMQSILCFTQSNDTSLSEDQLKSSLISSMRCSFFSSSLIMPRDVALVTVSHRATPSDRLTGTSSAAGCAASSPRCSPRRRTA